jgi:opacity protein-like surface antigen
MRRLLLLIVLIAGFSNAVAMRSAVAGEVATSPTTTPQTPPADVVVEQGINTHASGTAMPGGQPQLPEPRSAPPQQAGSGAAARTQEGAAKGLYVSLFIPYTSIFHDRQGAPDYTYLNSLDGGAGFGIRAGYSIIAHAALEWSLSTTWHETSQKTMTGKAIQNQLLTGTELDIKFRPPLPGSRLEPYILGGIGYTWLGDDFGTSNTHYRGRGIHAGFGAEYHLQHQLSFFAGLTRRRIVFDSGQWIGVADVTVNTATFDIGLVYHFE